MGKGDELRRLKEEPGEALDNEGEEPRIKRRSLAKGGGGGGELRLSYNYMDLRSTEEGRQLAGRINRHINL